MNGGAWAGSANATVPQDGGDALTETTRAIWGNISLVSSALKTMAAAAAAPPHGGLNAQVAVFLDPDDTGPLFGGDCNPCGYQDLHYGFRQWGTQVQFFLLHQLPTVDVSSLKLVIIHSARVMSTAVSDAVRHRLQRDNRTVFWTGAPGLLKSPLDDEFTRHDTVDLTRVREVTQIRGLVGNEVVQNVRTRLVQGPANSSGGVPVWPTDSLGSTIPLGHDATGIEGWTDGKGASNVTAPWFHYDPDGDQDNGTVVIGRFSGEGGGENAGLASVVWKDHGAWRTIWSCSGGFGMRAYRAVAESAGVHFYLAHEFIGDAVEAQGSAIMIHAGPSTASPSDPARVRTVSLPKTAGQVRLLDGGVVCTECRSFDTDPLRPGDTRLFEVSWSKAARVEGTPHRTVLKSDEHIHVSPHHRREQPAGRDFSVPPAMVHAGQQTFGLNVRDFGAVGDGVSGAILSPFGCACRLADHRLVPFR